MIFAARDGHFCRTGALVAGWRAFRMAGKGVMAQRACIAPAEDGRRRSRWALTALLAVACLAPLLAQAREETMSGLARGEFTVELKPLALEGASGTDGRGRMSIDKRIHGGLEATTRGQMLTATTGVDGSAVYVAIEEVSGTLDGRTGSFLLHHRGVMTRGEQALSVQVVPDSGTGELSGLSGEFRIRFEGGRHLYEFAYALPPVP